MFRKKEFITRTKLYADATILKTCPRKLHDLYYFMIPCTYLFFEYQLNYYQIQIKVTTCQAQLWPLNVNCVKVSSQSYLTGL